MKRYFIFLFSVFAAALCAQTMYFRSGEITAAEITGANIAIRNFDKDAFGSLPKKPLFAVLSVKIAPNRKISIVDYSLVIDGIAYPCAALGNNNDFYYTNSVQTGSNVQQLLFIVDHEYLQKINPFTLKCNLSPADGTYDLQVPFTNIGIRTPTSPVNIPAAGLLEITKK